MGGLVPQANRGVSKCGNLARFVTLSAYLPSEIRLFPTTCVVNSSIQVGT